MTTTTTTTAPSADPFAAAVTPETEKEIFSVGNNYNNNNNNSEFDAEEDELAEAFDGMFDMMLPESSCLSDDTSSPFSLSDEELMSLGISAFPTFEKQGLGYALTEEDLMGAKKSAAEAIAETLAALPVKEREQIIRDLYGISSNGPSAVNEDDPAFIQQKLEEMKEQLARLRNSYSWNLRLAAIELAERKNIAYVEDPKFRLKFLRADRYDAKKAAGRFIRFFDYKYELFGEDALTRRIIWNDLQPADQAALKKGYVQRLPLRDRAGRGIFVSVYNGEEYESVESVARQHFYMGCHTNEESDKKGHIHIFFKIKDFTFKKSPGTFGIATLMRFAKDFPLRVDAYHKMLEADGNSTMRRIVDYLATMMMPEIRVRSKVHEGLYTDWMTELMSFGIPQDVNPFTQSHKIKTKNHLEYLSMRVKAEEMLARNPSIREESLIDLPTRSDVLLGKGKPIQFSSGNQRLMTVVDGYLDQYHNKSNKNEKTALTFEIVRMVKESGVRFLCKDNGIWLEVSDEQARAKISYMFRHQKNKPPSKGKGAAGVVRAIPSDASIGATNETDDQTAPKRSRVEE